MPGKFECRKFSEIDLNDPFFNSLKEDYPEFASRWFPKCIAEGRHAWVFEDSQGLGAFFALKEENEAISLEAGVIPQKKRMKICTLLLAERFRGQRLGEGALGLILWEWQKSQLDEIYVTVFSEHNTLISQIEKLGFRCVGNNPRGEYVYLRSRKQMDFSRPYTSFPFISPNFKKGGYLIVDDQFHDTLFPYSDLKGTLQEQLEMDAANGITKVYVGSQWQFHYDIGEPVFIYRKYTGTTGQKIYRSCITSYCIMVSGDAVKRNNRIYLSFERFLDLVGNKSVFTEKELRDKYDSERNLTVLKLLYCGYFGAGNNVNCRWLIDNGLWSPQGQYPTETRLSPEQCGIIWSEGGIDTANVFGE